jgi:hypothetical protein
MPNGVGKHPESTTITDRCDEIRNVKIDIGEGERPEKLKATFCFDPGGGSVKRWKNRASGQYLFYD